MTLQNIFDNIQYGEDYTKNKAIKESIKNSYDEDIDVFYASKKVRELASAVTLSESEEQKINRLISKLGLIEDRLEQNKPMNEGYRKMQGAALANDCEALISEATRTKKIDNTKIATIGKIVADAEYFTINYLDENTLFKESSNPLLNKVIDEEYSFVEEVIEN